MSDIFALLRKKLKDDVDPTVEKVGEGAKDVMESIGIPVKRSKATADIANGNIEGAPMKIRGIQAPQEEIRKGTLSPMEAEMKFRENMEKKERERALRMRTEALQRLQAIEDDGYERMD